VRFMRARFLGVCLALLAAQGLAWAASPDPAAPQAPVPGKSAAAPAAPAAPAVDPKAKAAPVAAKPGAVAEPPWRVTLPSGITVALIGVSESPSQGKPWWRPDGSTLAHAPDHYPSSPETPTPGKLNQPANEFAILLTDLPLPHQQGDFEIIKRIEPPPPPGNGATDARWVSSRLREPSETTKCSQLHVLSQSFPPSQDRATIKVGLAAGPWNTIIGENIEGRHGRSASFRGIRGTDLDVSFAQPYEQEKSVFITVAHNIPPDQQVRVVAVLADGNEVTSGWNPEVANGHVQQITQSFGGLSIKDIKEFRVQARPFQWAEFKNVPLRPGASPAPKAPTAASSAPASDAQFFAELGYKDVANAHDAARALAILTSEGKECGGDFGKCKAYLQSRGVLPDGWLDKAKADEPVEKSNLARLVCRAMGIKGGLWMRLLGPLPRLALRECTYHELMAGGADYAYVSGGELVGVIDRCDRWRAKETGRELPKLESKPVAAEENK